MEEEWGRDAWETWFELLWTCGVVQKKVAFRYRWRLVEI